MVLSGVIMQYTDNRRAQAQLRHSPCILQNIRQTLREHNAQQISDRRSENTMPNKYETRVKQTTNKGTLTHNTCTPHIDERRLLTKAH